MNKAKLYKFVNTLLSILIAFIAAYFLFEVFLNKSNELNFKEILKALYNNHFSLVFALFLVLPNWLIESFKWKYILKDIQELTFFKALKSVLFGISLALITPNRIGEYGGRLIFIKKGKRRKALFLNTILSFSQLLITLIFGLITGVYFLIKTNYVKQNLLYPLASVSIIISVTLLYFFLKYRFKTKYLKHISSKFSRFNPPKVLKIERIKILGLSCSRYIIFVLQFIVLLQIFNTEITLVDSFVGVSTLYFVSAIIPTGWISELAVRTSLAYIIFQNLGYNGEAGILASTFLWIINLFFPALLGLLILNDIKWTELKSQLKWR